MKDNTQLNHNAAAPNASIITEMGKNPMIAMILHHIFFLHQKWLNSFRQIAPLV